MRILGIETSCDETAVCLIEAEGSLDAGVRFSILGNALYSQIAVHAPYGGVFPNLAKREHAKNLVPILQEALREAGELVECSDPIPLSAEVRGTLAREHELGDALQAFAAHYKVPQIDAIAVTHGPGLEPALWVGVNFAKALCTLWGVPLVAVNHMEGHIMLSAVHENAIRPIHFPLLSLLISGGHTELVLSRQWMEYELVGGTRDDAVGEAFDKVARLLGLPYPGGPEISRLAREARERGITLGETLPRAMMHSGDFDFSFSGMKTAMRRMAEARTPLSEETRFALSREFEDAAAEILVKKTLAAADAYGARTIIVGGGVSANTYIRSSLHSALKENGDNISLLVPAPSLATDNALMIALAGYLHAARGEYADTKTLAADGNLRLAKTA